MTLARLKRFSESLQTFGLDAAIFNPGPTLTYLSGLHFHLMERPVVLFVAPNQDPALVVPKLETLKADAFPYRTQIFAYGENFSEWEDAFQKAAQTFNLNGKRIGVEPRQLRLLEYRYVKASAPESAFPDVSDAVAALRLKKDSREISAIRQAVKIAQEALEALIPLIKIGMTERELASELVVQLLRHGSDPELPFAPIVSAGPNSADPHASPTDRKLQTGDLLVVDWGATCEGYISDLTRAFAVGDVDDEYKKIHQITQEANAAGCAAANPGVSCADVDAATRAVIEKSGYGQYFTHRTGHGIGMEVHEDPYIRNNNMQILEAGMMFTVEPGIYLPNRNGVRIEDNVLITENGAEILSDMPREIRVVG